MMREVMTDMIEDGYIAATNVCSPSGNVLLNKGAPITPAMGRRLRNWGITHVFIEGEAESGPSVETQKVSLSQIKDELYGVFHGTLESERMKRIYDAVCEYKLKGNRV